MGGVFSAKPRFCEFFNQYFSANFGDTIETVYLPQFVSVCFVDVFEWHFIDISTTVPRIDRCGVNRQNIWAYFGTVPAISD
jgi:hypothetical protein